MEERPKRVVERFYGGLSTGELNFDLLGDDLEWITPASLPWTSEEALGESATVSYRGLEEFGRYLQGLLASVEEMKAVATEVLELEDDRILVLGEEVGRARISGQEFRAPFAHLLSVSGGKIRRLHGYVDTAVIEQAWQSS